MTSLAFFVLIVCIFALLLAAEHRSPADPRDRLQPIGLWHWLISGNWPAKVGAGLLLIGLGALLRYALLNINLPPEAKLGGGVLAAAALGTASFALRNARMHRALHLALAGTAFGTAYLTAYAAFGLFGYLASLDAFALMVLTAIAAGIFAAQVNSMSVAVIAMSGAFAAPAFALGNPGAYAVYGYYLAAGALTFALVRLRGWRALIHLSFLFTLGGALFFGWTRAFYRPEHFEQMLPLLLALVALHLAMPLVERADARVQRAGWIVRVDRAYFLLLPVVAAALMLAIAPSVQRQGAAGLALLASLWGAAALALLWMKRSAVMGHAVVAAALLTAAVALSLDNVPWTLVALTLVVALLSLARRLHFSRNTEEVLGLLVAVLGTFQVLGSVFAPAHGVAFLNEPFVKRFLGAALMCIGASIARRRQLGFAFLLLVIAASWTLIVLGGELLRLQIAGLPMLVYAAVCIAAATCASVGMKRPLPPLAVTGLLAGLALAGAWAAQDAQLPWIMVAAALAPAIALSFAWACARMAPSTQSVAAFALLAAPIVLLPWLPRLRAVTGVESQYFISALLIGTVVLAMLVARGMRMQSAAWNESIVPFVVGAVSLALVFASVLNIERSPWAVLTEIFALSVMALATASAAARTQPRAAALGAVGFVGLAFVLQAALLRAFGPEGDLNILDLARMRLPAAISLLWALLGAALAWWSTRAASRSVWSIGTLLLAAAAAKLVLFDFGGLGQLGNILAFIAAGLVFLAVAWLAPIPPPARARPAPERAASSPARPAAVSAPQPPQSVSPAMQSPPSVPPDSERLPPTPPGATSPRERRGGWGVGIALLVGLFGGVAFLGSKIVGTHLPPAVPPSASAPPPGTTPAPAPRSALPSADAPTATPPADADRAPPHSNAAGPAAPPTAPPAPRLLDACSSFAQRIPNDAIILVGGAYAGRRAGFQIDASGHEATVFDVAVNEPGRRVVLVLGAYEPSVWNVRWSAGTEVVGVALSGYHKQAVAGIVSVTPVLEATYDARSACGYFHMSRENAAAADAFVRNVFGRAAHTYYLASNGIVQFGVPGSNALMQSTNARSVDQYRDQSAPAAGTAGLEQLQREGRLRPATSDDARAWSEALRRAGRTPPIVSGDGGFESPLRLRRTYVVLAAMQFPAGLYGAHSATFLVPPGHPRPMGNPGHSSVFDFNTLTCDGPRCDR